MLDYVDLIFFFFLVYFWLIVMFCLHALVVKRHVWVLYFPVWLLRNCGKILKLVPFNIVFFWGLWDSILNRVNKDMMVKNKILIWVSLKYLSYLGVVNRVFLCWGSLKISLVSWESGIWVLPEWVIKSL